MFPLMMVLLLNSLIKAIEDLLLSNLVSFRTYMSLALEVGLQHYEHQQQTYDHLYHVIYHDPPLNFRTTLAGTLSPLFLTQLVSSHPHVIHSQTHCQWYQPTK